MLNEKRERLIEILKSKPYGQSSYEEFADYLLKNDVEPVVKCKDCEYRTSSEFCECRDENAFCSDGDHKEEE